MSHINQPMHHQNRSRHLPPTLSRRDRGLSQTEGRKEQTRKLAGKRGDWHRRFYRLAKYAESTKSLQGRLSSDAIA
jgi:hypothetical protein